jgi:hypothetical protein
MRIHIPSQEQLERDYFFARARLEIHHPDPESFIEAIEFKIERMNLNQEEEPPTLKLIHGGAAQ